jgi:hypothetical protein
VFPDPPRPPIVEDSGLPRSPISSTIESTLMLPRVTKVAETLASGYRSVGLQPTGFCPLGLAGRPGDQLRP